MLSGDRPTLSGFAAEQSVALTRFAYLLCGDRTGAEDLVQEALLRLFRRFGDELPVDAPVASRRAGLVRSGVAWQAPDTHDRRWRFARRRHARTVPARRWALPAAAAAVVVALMVTVIVVRGSGPPGTDAAPGPAVGTTTTDSSTAGAEQVASLAPAPKPAEQQPVPAGMQAVDALGVEIFVPSSLSVDPPCAGKSVSRPASGLTYAIGCVALEVPAVWIMTATAPASWNDPPPQACANSVSLQGEAGCLTVTGPEPHSDPAAVTATIIWPRHDVAVVAEFPAGQRTQAMSVAESAHWVPVDRHGCAATRSPVVPANAASLPHAPVLPADATSTSACWYSGGRLVASATLPSAGSAQDLEHPGAPGNAPGIGAAPPYTPSPDGPACGTLGRSEGIVFQSTRPDGSIAVSAAQFADCRGGQSWTDGTHSQPVDEALASALHRLAGFLLVFGYRTTPLDPDTSGAAPESASDLPLSTSASNGPVAPSASGPSTGAGTGTGTSTGTATTR